MGPNASLLVWKTELRYSSHADEGPWEVRDMFRKTVLYLLSVILMAAIGVQQFNKLPAVAATPDSILANKKPSPLSEPNFDRPGTDFRNFDMASDDPWVCESACNGDRRCKSWTYVKPGVQGPKARCWLKAGIPPMRSNACCTSGIKAGFCDSGYTWDTNAKECRRRVN